MKKYLIIPNSSKTLKTLNKQGFSSFILPIKDYSIGFEKYYTVKEINNLSSQYEISIIINKFLHKEDLKNIKEILPKLNNIKGYFIEDLSLTKYLPKNKIIINQNHIINNYKSINMFNTLGYKNVVISNELTLDEIKEIRKNTKSKLFYFVLNKNSLLYSKRNLISNYNKNFKKLNLKHKKVVAESKSKHKLLIKEEQDSSIIFNYEIFNGFKYIKELEANVNYLIVNLNNLENKELENVIKSLINKDIKIGECKFLEEKIGYKVKGD